MHEGAEKIVAHMGPFMLQRRKKLGLSLDKVARRAGMAKSYIWEMEKGRNRNPTIATALALCGALQCSLKSLLGMDVSQPMFTDDEMALIAAHRQIFNTDS